MIDMFEFQDVKVYGYNDETKEIFRYNAALK